jgi:hypothetical protein
LPFHIYPTSRPRLYLLFFHCTSLMTGYAPSEGQSRADAVLFPAFRIRCREIVTSNPESSERIEDGSGPITYRVGFYTAGCPFLLRKMRAGREAEADDDMST